MKFEGSYNQWTINNFQKLSTLGRGSFGIVYKIRSVETGKVYALKEIEKGTLIDN